MSKDRKGLFITLEGIDGTGKSTQARMLASHLKAMGLGVIETREPGGSPGAEEIRRLLVEGEPGRWSPKTETLLFNAARLDHVGRVVLPALERGDVVVCDRYVDSTRAYQTQKGAEARAMVELIHKEVVGLNPDLTFIIDLDPEVAVARAAGRGGKETRFEKKGIEFQRHLRATYLDIAEKESRRCMVIDGNQTIEAVSQDIWDEVRANLSM